MPTIPHVPFIDYDLSDGNRVKAEWLNAVNTDLFAYAPIGGVARNARYKWGDVLSIQDFGASPSASAAANKLAIQTAWDLMSPFSALYYPPGDYDIDVSAGGLLIPSVNAVVHYGPGLRGTTLSFVGGNTSTDLISRRDTNPLQVNNINHVTFRGLAFEATTSTSRNGINWLSMSNSVADDLYFGSIGGAAILMNSSLACQVQGLKVNQAAYGLRQSITNWTGLNGLTVLQFYLSLCSVAGISIEAGMAMFELQGLVESSLSGITLGQDCRDGVIQLYGEGNVVASTNCQDLYIGSTGECNNIHVEPGLSNGDTTADDFHYPIRLKFAKECTIDGGTLTTGSKYLKIEAGGNVGGCTFGPIEFANGAFVPTNEAQATYNFGANTLKFFLNSNNQILPNDNVKLVRNNVLHRRLPYGGWIISATATSSILKSNVDVAGLYGVRMIRGTDACEFSLVYTVGPEFRGNFFGLCVPVLPRISNKLFNLIVTPNGTGFEAQTMGSNSLQAGTTYFPTVTGFAPDDCTTITLTVQAGANSSDFDVGHPCLYAGATPWYDSAAAHPYWLKTAGSAPADGTWAVTDEVKNLTPTAGQPKSQICSVTGTPGTWLSTGNF